MATHSSVLAWRIPWTEEPGGLVSMGLQRLKRFSMHTGTVAHQASLSMGFPKQDCWSGLPFPSPWDLPNLGI